MRFVRQMTTGSASPWHRNASAVAVSVGHWSSASDGSSAVTGGITITTLTAVIGDEADHAPVLQLHARREDHRARPSGR